MSVILLVYPCHYVDLGCESFRKSKIGLLNPKSSKSRFCVSLLNRLIQDHSDHGASKEPKCEDSSDLLTVLMHHDPSYLELICLVKKRKIRFLDFRI